MKRKILSKPPWDRKYIHIYKKNSKWPLTIVRRFPMYLHKTLQNGHFSTLDASFFQIYPNALRNMGKIRLFGLAGSWIVRFFLEQRLYGSCLLFVLCAQLCYNIILYWFCWIVVCIFSGDCFFSLWIIYFCRVCELCRRYVIDVSIARNWIVFNDRFIVKMCYQWKYVFIIGNVCMSK